MNKINNSKKISKRFSSNKKNSSFEGLIIKKSEKQNMESKSNSRFSFNWKSHASDLFNVVHAI